MGSRIFKQQTLQRVVHDKTLDGDGTPQAPLGVTDGSFLTASSSPTLTGNWTFTNIALPSQSVTFANIQNLGAVSLFARTATSAGIGGNFTIGTQSLPIRRGTGALESHQFPANSALIRSGTGLVTATAASNDTVQGRDGSGSLGWIKVALGHLATSLLNILFRGTITTNSNGTSIRFQLGSLGVQLCHHSINLGSRVAIGAGTYANPWRSEASDWTFPQAFDSAPHFVGVGFIDTATAAARQNSISARSTSTTQVNQIQAGMLSDTSTDVDVIAHVWAIGTWTP